MRKPSAVLSAVLILLAVCGSAEAVKIRPLTGLVTGARAGYWNHAGGSLYFGNGVDGGAKVGFRFEPGDLEVFGFFDFCYILPKEGGLLGEDETATLMTFGLMSRVIFIPDNWITPFVSAGPSFEIRKTSLGFTDDGEGFSYRNDSADFSLSVELGVEFPLPPHSNVEVGARLHHVVAPNDEEGFAGLSFYAGYNYYF